MKSFFSAIALLVLLIVSAPVDAQTTYTLPSGATFMCDAESYAGQIVCRGIPMADSADTPVGSFFIFSFGREGANLPGVPYDPYGTITNFKFPYPAPALGKIATFSFDWEQDGHSGTATATYKRVQVCGNRCWVHPELLTFSVTVNASTVNLPDGPAPMPGCGCGCMRCAPSLNKGSKTCPYRGQCAKKNS